MKLSIPSRLAGVIGALLAVAGVLVNETHWSHELKLASTAAIIAAAAWVVHPAEGGVITRPQTAAKPDGAQPPPMAPPGL